MNSARLRERNVDACLAKQLTSEPRPLGRRLLRPGRVGRETGALPLHPDQTEVGARSTMRDVAFVEERELRSERTQAEGDGGADEPSAYNGDFERPDRAHV